MIEDEKKKTVKREQQTHSRLKKQEVSNEIPVTVW